MVLNEIVTGINMNKNIIIFSLMLTSLLFGCSKSGSEYYENAKTSYNNKEYNKAVELFEKACNNGNFQGCLQLANIYNKGEVMEKNTEKAEFFYNETLKYSNSQCENNNKEACSVLAKLYEKGLGVQQDLEVSDKYQIKACSLGAYGNCYYIARIKADNMDEFLRYMDKACSLDFADACLSIGNTYLLGFNENMAKINKDINKGLSYIAKACQLNNQYCANLADIYISGDDIAQNYTDAVKNYETAVHYYESLCKTYDENNIACRNINIIKSKYSIN